MKNSTNDPPEKKDKDGKLSEEELKRFQEMERKYNERKARLDQERQEKLDEEKRARQEKIDSYMKKVRKRKEESENEEKISEEVKNHSTGTGLVKVETEEMALERKEKEDELMTVLGNKQSPARIDDVLKSEDKRGIAFFKKELSEQKIRAYLKLKLIELNDYFNFGPGKRMNEEQMELVIDDILTDYYYLTPADINLFLKMFRKGKLIKTYQSLGVAKVVEALEKYVELRTSRAIEESSTQHLGIKNQESSGNRNTGISKLGEFIKNKNQGNE